MLGWRGGSSSRFIITAHMCTERLPTVQVFCVLCWSVKVWPQEEIQEKKSLSYSWVLERQSHYPQRKGHMGGTCRNQTGGSREQSKDPWAGAFTGGSGWSTQEKVWGSSLVCITVTRSLSGEARKGNSWQEPPVSHRASDSLGGVLIACLWGC